LDEFKQNMLEAIEKRRIQRDIELLNANAECFKKEAEENLEFQDAESFNY